MEFKDYYRILEIDPSASNKEIKAAYRKLARKFHPDVSEAKDASNKFKEVAEAYEVLKNSETRAEYDELRVYGAHGQSFNPPPDWQSGNTRGTYAGSNENFSEFFSSIFGNSFHHTGSDGRANSPDGFQGWGEARQRRGQDIESELPVFLEDTLKESSHTVSYHLGDKKKTLKVSVPQGITNGERIRLKGQGSPGTGSQPSGDLYLRIRLVPHPLFDVEGHNLIIVLPLSPWEAVLGSKVDIPTLSGNVVISIPPNIQSGQRLRVRGKGLPNKQGKFGDLYAVIKIVTPADSETSTDRLWQQLAETSNFEPRSEWRNFQ